MVIMDALCVAMMLSGSIVFGMGDIVQEKIPREEGFYTQLGMNATNTSSSVPLLDAVIHNNLEDLIACLQSGIDINVTGDVDRVDGKNAGLKDVNALMVAAMYGRPRIMKYLIRNHAELDHGDILGNTALMMAAWHGRTSLVRLLVKAGANKSIRNKADLTALQEAEGSSLIKERPDYYNKSHNFKFSRMCNLLKITEDDTDVCYIPALRKVYNSKHKTIKLDAHKNRHTKVHKPVLRKVNNLQQRSYDSNHSQKNNNCSPHYSLSNMSYWPQLVASNDNALNKSIGTQVGLAALEEQNNFALMKNHSNYYNISSYWHNDCCYYING